MLTNDDDLYFDNPDDDQDLDPENLEDQEDLEDSDPDESDEDEKPRKKGGNLHKALQEERRQRQQLERDLQRAQSLLQHSGQQGHSQHQTRQPDPALIQRQREQLQEMMLERPDEFLASYGLNIRNQILSEIRQQQAPMLIPQAERIIARNAEHRALYENPEVRDVVDAFVSSQVESGAISSLQDLSDVIPEVMNSLGKIVNAVSGGTTGGRDPAKQRLSTSVGRGSTGGNRKSMDQVWAEKEKLAKTNPKAYVEWKDSDKGKAFLNSYLFGK